MRRYLLASTAVLALSTPAGAEDITTQRSTPVATSTVKNGAPDAIKITSTGKVVVNGGTAVTMDSNHAVTNQGAVTIGNASGATGILATAGTTGVIDNSGTITIDEPYTATDTDKDGDLDGPFALGSDRFGIRTAGAHSGKIVNTGTISVEGNDSAGIWLGGAQNGAVTNDGTIKILGDNGVALQAQDITGNVRLAGTVTAQGEGSVAARFSGDVTGAMEIQGTISSTGYRYTSVPSDTSKLDVDDLLQGGSAVMIEGDVTGGIVLAVPPKDANADNKDEDGDGIEDSKEGSAKIASYGAAPAMVIGASDRAVSIGPVAGTASKFGLQIDGAILGAGLYSGVNGNGLVVGGRGGDVTIANGIGISGSVSATSKGANATALRLGAGATVPKLQNSGTIEASGGSSSTARTTAVMIDAGANLGTIANSGTIKATAGGDNGTATAILDSSGSVSLVTNSGAITATGAKADSTRNVAIDLSARGAGATVRQTAVGSGVTAPSIKGDIRFGSGGDTLDIADGTFAGTAYFGAGNNTYGMSGDAAHAGDIRFGAGNDTMTLGGTARFAGKADFGGGADTLTVGGTSYFGGTLANASSLAINLTGGTLDLSAPASFASLNAGAGSTLVVTLDKDVGEGSLYDVSGSASFASGTKLGVRLANVDDAEGSFVVLQADSIAGASGLSLVTDGIPFLFKAELGTAPANQIVVDVARRTTTELGLNRAQTSAYDAIFAALGEDEDIEKIFLGISDGDMFRAAVKQMMPDHAGGAFEGISLGSRTFARQVADPPSPVYSRGGLDVIVSTAFWTSDKDAGDTAAYDLGGFGFSAAAEVDTGVGAFGTSLTWLWNEYDQGSEAHSVQSDTYELGAYWRGEFGGFTSFARGSIGKADMNGRRIFAGVVDEKAVEHVIEGKWGGTVMTASGGLAYEGGGRHLFFRPAVSVDYVSLDEDSYSDTGGGDALRLTVEDRKSDEFAVNGGLTLGVDFTGQGRTDENWFRIEGEGGWREIVGGALGATTAHFEDGTPFTIEPEELDNGWYARLRAVGGREMFEVGGELGAEERHGSTAMALRGSLRMGF